MRKQSRKLKENCLTEENDPPWASRRLTPTELSLERGEFSQLVLETLTKFVDRDAADNLAHLIISACQDFVDGKDLIVIQTHLTGNAAKPPPPDPVVAAPENEDQ